MWTVGAETRRVRYGRPPRKGTLSIELQGAWRRWKQEDGSLAAVLVYNSHCRRVGYGGRIYQSRTFGAPVLLHFHGAAYALRYLRQEANRAYWERRKQTDAEAADVKLAMERFTDGTTR